MLIKLQDEDNNTLTQKNQKIKYGIVRDFQPEFSI